MPWLMLLLALAAFVAAFTTASVAVLLACLAASFVLALAGVFQLLARRVRGRSRDAAAALDPAGLQRWRERAGPGPGGDA